MSRTRPGRTPYWPDRSALRRRRSARRAFWVAVALVLVLPWFGYRHVRDWLRPEASLLTQVAALGALVAVAMVIYFGTAFAIDLHGNSDAFFGNQLGIILRPTSQTDGRLVTHLLP